MLKKISWIPVPAAVLWTLLLIPFHFGTNLFSAPAFLGSAGVLSAVLWIVGKDPAAKDRAFLILPALVFLYEAMPINIPGPVDEWLAFGGSATNLTILMLKRWALGPSSKVCPKNEKEGQRRSP